MSAGTKKFLKILIFSILEALTIGVIWDIFFDKGAIVVASVLTFLLLAVEHILARNTGDGLPLFANFFKRFGWQALLGATEILAWDVWRLIHERVAFAQGIGPVLAIVVFALLMTVQHNAEHNVASGQKIGLKLFRAQGLNISFIESLTAGVWLFADDVGTGHRFLALIPLTLGLVVEHVTRVFGEEHGANF